MTLPSYIEITARILLTPMQMQFFEWSNCVWVFTDGHTKVRLLQRSKCVGILPDGAHYMCFAAEPYTWMLQHAPKIFGATNPASFPGVISLIHSIILHKQLKV